MLQDIKDPRIKFVTVTGVELTDDISLAKVYVSLYGTEKTRKKHGRGLIKPWAICVRKLPKESGCVLHRH